MLPLGEACTLGLSFVGWIVHQGTIDTRYPIQSTLLFLKSERFG